MKIVLFCGGLGTRIRDYSENIPKPMVPVGNYPIMWHVMQYYSQYGHNEFILCLGYKANIIKNYFINYRMAENSDCVISDFGSKVDLIGEAPPIGISHWLILAFGEILASAFVQLSAL